MARVATTDRDRKQRSPERGPDRLLRIEITARTMVLAVVITGGATMALRLTPVILVLVVALFLVGTLGPAVEWLEARGIRRGAGIGIVFGAMLIVSSALLALTVPALIGQITALVRQEPTLRAHLVSTLSRSRATLPLAEHLARIDYETLASGFVAQALEYSRRTAELVAYLASAVSLALYIMIDRDRLRGGLYAVVPRRHHIRLSRVLMNLESIVGGYIRGQVLTSVLMCLFTFLLLTFCGVKSALTIGVVAGIADVLPYLGVFLSVGPAVAVAAPQGMGTVLVVLCAMLAYEEIESRFLVPRIYGSALKLPSSVVLFSLLAGGVLMGIPGALLALPVAATVRMLVAELRVDLPGEDIDDSEVRASDARAERDYERRVEGVPAGEAAAIAVEIAELHAKSEGEHAG
jgi:predicted PurR-regulated permease PerM